MAAVGRNSLSKCPDEVRIGPTPDAVFFIRRNIRRVEIAKRGLDRGAAGGQRPLALGIGVTIRAAACRRSGWATGGRLKI